MALLSLKYENKLIIFIFRKLVMLMWVKMLAVLSWSLPPLPLPKVIESKENSHL